MSTTTRISTNFEMSSVSVVVLLQQTIDRTNKKQGAISNKQTGLLSS